MVLKIGMFYMICHSDVLVYLKKNSKLGILMEEKNPHTISRHYNK